MKKLTALLLAFGVIANTTISGTAFASASDPEPDESLALEDDEALLVGGWNLEHTASIPESAMEAFTKALDGIEGASYEPVQLLATQVVAGTNYAILCQVTVVYPGAVPEYCIAYVYEDLEGNSTLTEVKDLISVSTDDAGEWAITVSEEEDSVVKAALERIRCDFYDFDFDGKDELVISASCKEDKGDEYVLSVYTQTEDQVIQLFSSSEISRFYITALTDEGDYSFYCIGNMNAESFEYIAYAFYDKTLHISQAVRYDSHAENSWMMGYDENGDLVYTDAIDEETGKAIIASAENNRASMDQIIE